MSSLIFYHLTIVTTFGKIIWCCVHFSLDALLMNTKNKITVVSEIYFKKRQLILMKNKNCILT